MTRGRNRSIAAPELPRPSLSLPFDPRELMAIRVRPAELARMALVSKQTVSRWIKDGIVTLGPDGLVDPVRAFREVLGKTDPAKSRARIFRDATRSHSEMRAEIDQLRRQLANTERAIEHRCADRQAVQLGELADCLTRDFPALAHAHRSDPEAFAQVLDRIISAVFYPEQTPGADPANN